MIGRATAFDKIAGILEGYIGRLLGSRINNFYYYIHIATYFILPFFRMYCTYYKTALIPSILAMEMAILFKSTLHRWIWIFKAAGT